MGGGGPVDAVSSHLRRNHSSLLCRYQVALGDLLDRWRSMRLLIISMEYSCIALFLRLLGCVFFMLRISACCGDLSRSLIQAGDCSARARGAGQILGFGFWQLYALDIPLACMLFTVLALPGSPSGFRRILSGINSD